MRKYAIIVLCLFLSGCVYTEINETPEEARLFEHQKSLTNLRRVKIGMSYQEVSAIMGDQIKIGYRQNEEVVGTYKIISIANPHRTEVLKGKEADYTIAYYITHIQKPDGLVAEDELTPLIFEDNKLISKGWDALFKIRNNLK